MKQQKIEDTVHKTKCIFDFNSNRVDQFSIAKLVSFQLTKTKYGLIIGHNGRIFKYAVSLDATEEQLRLADYELDILNRYLYDNSRDFKNNIDDEIGILKDFGVEFEVIR